MNSYTKPARTAASASRRQGRSARSRPSRRGRDAARAANVTREVLSCPSFAHRSEGDAAQQMAAQQDGETQDRDEEQRRGGGDRGPVLATLADNEGNEGRHGLRFAAGE